MNMVCLNYIDYLSAFLNSIRVSVSDRVKCLTSWMCHPLITPSSEMPRPPTMESTSSSLEKTTSVPQTRSFEALRSFIKSFMAKANSFSGLIKQMATYSGAIAALAMKFSKPIHSPTVVWRWISILHKDVHQRHLGSLCLSSAIRIPNIGIHAHFDRQALVVGAYNWDLLGLYRWLVFGHSLGLHSRLLSF